MQLLHRPINLMRIPSIRAPTSKQMVAVKCRPLTEVERRQSRRIIQVTDDKGLVVLDPDLSKDYLDQVQNRTKERRYSFDNVFDSKCTNAILTGHKENVEFALGMSPATPFVLSGGKDKLVVLWRIHDHISVLGEASKSPVTLSVGSRGKQVKSGSDKSSEGTKVTVQGVFQGYFDTIKYVQFDPFRQESLYFKIISVSPDYFKQRQVC